jgi:hypothetical protein
VTGSKKVGKWVLRLSPPGKDQGGINKFQGGWSSEWAMKCDSKKKENKHLWRIEVRIKRKKVLGGSG